MPLTLVERKKRTMSGASTSANRVRWGILSTANIGLKAMAPAIRASSNGQLIAIASRDRARAEQITAAEPGMRAYGTYAELLADPEVEAVYIPLPNSMHMEWTLRAAEQGKHVLCEKPLGVTSEEVRRMSAACKQAGVLLMEAFMYRFHPQIRWTLDHLATGAIGDVRLVRSGFAFDIRPRPENIRLQASLAGGSLMDIGCYPLNLCRAVFGGAPSSVAARAIVPEDSEVERTMAAILDFGNGRLGLIDSSFEQPWQQFAEIVGEGGRIVLPRPFTPQGAETVARIERDDEMQERRFAAVDHYQLEVEHFGECIRTGAAPFLSPLDALEQAEAVEAIYAAAGYSWPR